MSDDSGGVISDIAEIAGDVAGAVGGELKKIGQSAASQITGQVTSPSQDDEVAELAKKDQRFSQEAAAQVRAKIATIYQEYARKRQQEAIAKQKQEAAEQQKKEAEEIEKQEQEEVLPAVTKTRAEIKNYGAE